MFDWEEQIFDFLDHWVDVFQNGAQPDVKRVYHNADAALDIPANFFWEEILEAFPDCKVILSEREVDSWVKSFENQLEMFEKNNQLISRTHLLLSKTSRKFYDVASPCYHALFGSFLKPKPTCVFKKRYRMHNDRVKSIVPAEKLLVYNVKQGWKPLCDFLGCEVPTSAFPHENVKGEIATSMKETAIGWQKIGKFKELLLSCFLLSSFLQPHVLLFAFLDEIGKAEIWPITTEKSFSNL